ncbi:MAG: hypothetical protein NC429_10790 [Lachnospiraceae bacterium]|nr:hypothetical protein [Lachnospiraceae bacterium]
MDKIFADTAGREYDSTYMETFKVKLKLKEHGKWIGRTIRKRKRGRGVCRG